MNGNDEYVGTWARIDQDLAELREHGTYTDWCQLLSKAIVQMAQAGPEPNPYIIDAVAVIARKMSDAFPIEDD